MMRPEKSRISLPPFYEYSLGLCGPLKQFSGADSASAPGVAPPARGLGTARSRGKVSRNRKRTHGLPGSSADRFCGRAAFTLIEVLVVVGIIALLISIALPLLGRSRMLARQTVCASNLRQIGLAMTMYASSNRSWGPPWAGWVSDFVLANNSGPKGYRSTGWTEALYPFLGGRDDPRLLEADPDLEAKWQGYPTLHVYHCPGRPYEPRYFSSYFYNALPSFVEFLSRSRITRDELETNDPGSPIAVHFQKVTVPSAFILAADCGSAKHFAAGLDWDRDNASDDLLPWGAADGEQSNAHDRVWNILFLDGHVDPRESFAPGSMTYAYENVNVSYDDLLR